MRVLITGGAGFIGSNLAKMCASQGIDVTVIDDLSTGSLENLAGLDIDVVEGSILDDSLLAQATKGAESVVHLAALGSVPRSIEDPVPTHVANATGTICVLEAMRQFDVNHLVVASSSSVYGRNPKLPKSETDWVGPMSPYAVSKLATEQYALAYQESYGLSVSAFRFFNVFGPGQRAGHAYAAVIPAFVEALINDRPLIVFGDGGSARDFTYVGTVCSALLSAVKRRLAHDRPVNLAFGTSTTILELIELLEEITSITPTVEFRNPRMGDVRTSSADDQLLVELFPDIVPVPLEVGLKETIEWAKAVS